MDGCERGQKSEVPQLSLGCCPESLPCKRSLVAYLGWTMLVSGLSGQGTYSFWHFPTFISVGALPVGVHFTVGTHKGFGGASGGGQSG